MKGVFQIKPTLPPYSSIWDVKPVLQYLELMDTSTLLSLSCKLCMLFLLVTAQRCQTLHVIKLTDIFFSAENVIINISSLLKQTKPGTHLKPIALLPYITNEKLCIVQLLK